MPIRYGRAWVYPTGMTDALWQIYRDNPYDVTKVNSIEEAFNAYMPGGDRRVYIFDHFVLKQGIQSLAPKTAK